MSDEEVVIDGRTKVGLKEAKSVIAGYCFEVSNTRLHAIRPKYEVPDVRDALELDIMKWAYASYDCVPGSDDDALDLIDLLVTDGINARLNQASITGFLAVKDAVSAALPSNGERAFWDLEIASFPAGAPGSREWQKLAGDQRVAWEMCRAWYLLRRTPGFNVARTHKVLHHKRPRQFPLLDNRTAEHMSSPDFPNDRGERYWEQILRDLRSKSRGWEHLETWFQDELLQSPTRPGLPLAPVALTRLRMYDILLWAAVKQEDWDQLKDAGDDIRRSAGV